MSVSPDRALARRLGAAEAAAGIWCQEALERVRPGAGGDVERLAGGTIAFAGIASPLTRVRGIGMAGPVSEEEVDRLERFYESRGVSPSIPICPYADPTLLEHLGRRGYSVTDFDNVLVRPVAGAAPAPELPEGMRVARAGAADQDAWARVVAQGFGGAEEVTEEAIDMGRLIFHEPRAAGFWAHVDGRLAGGGAMANHDGLASFFGASTRTELRGRGVQRALLEARLAHAAALGCDLASVVTAPGSASQRNAERAGFRVVYTRVTVARSPARAPGA